MSRTDIKGKRFEFLVQRIDDSLKSGYFVEAMSITYSLFEERTYALLDRLAIPRNRNDKLNSCLQTFEKQINTSSITAVPTKCSSAELTNWLKVQFLDSGLITRIQKWRLDRNKVIHDLAKQNIDYHGLATVAKDGRDAFRIYTSLIMQLKKMLS